MAESKRLAAHRAAAAQEPCMPDQTVPETEPDEHDEDSSEGSRKKKEEKTMADEADTKALDAARAEATKAANDRFNAVLASEHYATNPALARTLLANDKLTADEVIAALEVAKPAAAAAPAAPQLTEEQQREAAEAAGRDAMKAALEETANSGIDAGSGGNKPDPKAAADAVWTHAYGLDPQNGVK